jgi:glycosyltransferase 2 family protein
LIFTLNIGFWTSLLISIMVIITMMFFGLMIYVGYNKEVATRIIISLAKRIYPFAKKLTSKETSFTNVRNKLIEYIETFTTGFQGVLKDHRMFILGVLISFLIWGLDNLRFYLTFGAIGYYPPVIPMIIIYTVSILVSILPTLPGALGIREATMVALFLPVGVPADVVLAASLLDRLVTYILPTFIGALTTFYYGKKYKDTKISIA